jgi:hypothetical protein
MAEIKLAKLRDRKPVRIAISVLPDLNQALLDYGTIYAEAYGEAEPIEELIPAMLAAFLEGDRSFARRRRDLR